MIIPKKVEKALNDHLTLEMHSNALYLSVSSWCQKEGMDGSANFFSRQSAEENVHFLKFFNFINEVGGHALVPAVAQPKHHFNSVLECCELAYATEQKVTKSIYKMLDIARNEGDHATLEFLKFFVEEQMEEEVLFKRIIDKIKLIGKGPQSMYYIDKEMDRFSAMGTAEDKKGKKEKA